MALKSEYPFPLEIPAVLRLICFGALAAGMLAVAQPALAEDTQDAVESAVDSDQIQRDRPLPERDAKSGGAQSGDAQSREDRARKSIDEIEKQPDIQHNPPEPRPPEPPPSRTLDMDLSWLPYAILGVIGIALAYVLLRYVGQRFAGRQSAAAKAAPVAAAASHVVAAPEAERDHTFDEVDALAASGAFTEAVHRLLLLVQERLRGRIEHGIQASLTSREILRRAKLPQEAATAFATLVAAVEVSLFGMRAANAATYALCREHSRHVLAAAAA
jgi:hypothetical protein